MLRKDLIHIGPQVAAVFQHNLRLVSKIIKGNKTVAGKRMVGGDCQIKWLTDNPYRLRPLGLMKAESQIQCARTDLVQDIIGSAFCKMKANLAVFLLLIKSVHRAGIMEAETL